MADTKEKTITPENTQEPSLAELLAEIKSMRAELQDAQTELEKAREEKEESWYSALHCLWDAAVKKKYLICA